MTTRLDPNWTAFTGENQLHLSEDGLIVTNLSHSLSRGIASDCISSGRAYFEAKCVVRREGGHCWLGWSNRPIYDQFLGYSSDSEKWDNGFPSPYGVSFGENDIIGCYLDIEERTISFSLNGISQGIAFSGTEMYFSTYDRSEVFYPAYSLCGASAEFNFGASPFVHSPGNFHAILACAPQPFPRINKVRDEVKNTVLHTAVCDGNYELVSTLLKCGANVELRNRLGRTPLHTATYWGKDEIALLLVESGRASIFSLCTCGETPIDYLLKLSTSVSVSKDIVRSYRWPRRKHFVNFLYFCKLIILSDSRRINNLVSVDAKGRAGAGALGLDWDYEDLFRQNGVYPQWIVGAGQEDTAARYCELIKYSKDDHNSNSRKIAPKAAATAAAGTAAIDSMSDVICGVQQIKVSVCATGGRAAMSVLRQDSLICMIASYL